MMYLLAKFFHVLSVLGLTAGMTIERLEHAQIRSALTREELLSAIRKQGLVGRIALPSYLTILVTGIYMARAVIGNGSWWIAVSLVAFFLMAAVGGVLTGRTFVKSQRILRSETANSFSEAKDTLSGRAIKASWRIRMLLVVTILALMVFQPGLWISSAIVLSGLALPLLSLFVHRRPAKRRA
jgi:uncharacterized membrane protein